MTDPPRIFGAVLAGGQSRRMGTDKATLPVDGETLLARTLRALAPLDARVVVGRPRHNDGVDPAAVEWVSDLVPNQGPVNGVCTAARIAGERGYDWLLFAPCDIPGLGQHHIEALVKRLRHETTADVVIAAGAEQPNWVFGALRTTALDRLEAAAASSTPSLRGTFTQLGFGVWVPPNDDALNDVDTYGEFNAWIRNAPGREPAS